MMRWALRLLSCHPDVQEKIQREIDQVAGKGCEVQWEMRSRMPYTMATLKEIQRFADIAPTGLMHKTVCDVALDGFNLPQDTLVLANHSACHKVLHQSDINYDYSSSIITSQDPKYWAKPDQFIPEHFLENGEVIEDKPGFIPYGVGKRVCPGAALADIQVILLISNNLDHCVADIHCSHQPFV